MAATESSGGTSELRSGSIGLADVIFQSITYMAPGVGLAFSIGIAVGISGATLPMSVVVALIACTFAAVAIGQLAKHIPSAGGLYTYAAKGLGVRPGFVVGWFYVGFALFLPGSLFTLGGWFADGFMERELGLSIGWFWYGLAIALCALALTFFDVRMSAKATIILGAVEIIVFLALGVTMIIRGENSADPFTPSAGADSWPGIMQGAVFAILAFIGFEAASALGEEAKDPRRTVPRGVIGSCIAVGIFYVFMTYAWNAGAKMDIIGQYEATGGSAWDAFGSQYWGGAFGAWVLFFALINSVIACATASTNNAARVLFSMGRSGSAPAILGRVHPKYKSPYVAVLATLVGTFVACCLAGQLFLEKGLSDPLTIFAICATFFTVVAIFIYLTSCVACIAYFSREGRPHRSIVLHVIVPLIGILAFVLPLYTQYWSLSDLFDGSLFTWAYKDEAGGNLYLSKANPFTFSVVGAAIWLVAGIVQSLVISKDRLVAATHAFGGEDAEILGEGHAESMSLSH